MKHRYQIVLHPWQINYLRKSAGRSTSRKIAHAINMLIWKKVGIYHDADDAEFQAQKRAEAEKMYENKYIPVEKKNKRKI